MLGLWWQETEGAKFWLAVLNDLHHRGVEDVLIACVDGLTGFPEAIEAVFPQAWVQTCIVHQIRSSMRYVAYQDRKKVAAALKPVYGAVNVDAAEHALAAFDETWGAKYPMIAASWRERWTYIIPFLSLPADLRRAVYTTNSIENLNRQIRKSIKTRGHFPDEQAATKLIYLAILRAEGKWRQAYNWTTALRGLKTPRLTHQPTGSGHTHRSSDTLHTGDDPPDRVPRDPQQGLDLVLGHPLGAKRDQVFELAGVPSAAARPRDRLYPHPAVAAAHPSELVLQKAAITGQIQMPPATDVPIVHARIDLAAHRTGHPPAAKPDPHDHPLSGQPHVRDAGPRERQQPVQCRTDAHAVPPLKSSCSRHQQPSPRAGGASPRSAQPAKRTSAAANARLSRPNDRSPSTPAPTQTREGPRRIARFREIAGWFAARYRSRQPLRFANGAPPVQHAPVTKA